MSLLDTASLIVTPNGYKEGKLYSVIPSDGSGDMSVTRATTATRVNSAGLVELVPYNIFTYSSSFSNAVWGKLNATVTGGQSGYDGTTNAFLLTDDSTSGVHIIAQVPIVSGQHTISIYAKANTLNWVWLRGVQSSANVRAWFNLSTGTIGNVETNGTANIESVGNGWYRCSLTIANHQSGFEFYYGVANANNTTNYVGSGQSIFVQDAQLVEGSTALPYQKTETRLNIPRLDYSNGTCPSLLVEPQRTNVLTYSEQLNDSSWNNSGAVTANAVISPSGILNADRVTGILYKFISITNGTAYTLSFYAKKNTSTTFVMRLDVPSINNYTYDFDAQTASSGATIESVGNGWFYCTASVTATSTQTGVFYVNVTNADLYLWGMQLEAGSYATSYIPTTSASVTRNADVISKTGISSLIGQTEGVIFYDFILSTTGVDFTLANLYSSSNANSYSLFYINPSNQIGVSMTNNGSTECEIIVPTLALGRHRIAFAYKQNDFVVYVDGVQIGTDTNGTIPTMDSLNLIGFNLAPSAYRQEVNIYAAALWPTRLTNTQLAQLTTI